jgi:hypothetical protein
MAAALERWRDETADSSPAKITPDKFDRQTGQSLKVGKAKMKAMDEPPPGADRNAARVNAEGI